MTTSDTVVPTSLGWGLVGTGVLADISIAPALEKLAGSHLSAVCSRSYAKASDFVAKHSAGTAFDDYAAMLDSEDVDIVYIASPNSLHFEQAMAALDAGKHVLVEKPMALSTADGLAMVRAAESAGRCLGVGFHLRHKASAIAGREAIAGGRIGSVFYAEMAIGAGKGLYPYDTWRADPALAGGGSLLHQGTHAVDLAAYLCGSPIVEVSAMMDRAVDEDVFVGSCRLADGTLVNMASHSRRPGTRPDWTVFGEAGWIAARGGTAPVAGDTAELHTDEGTTVLATSATPAYAAEVAAFADAVRSGRVASGDGLDGLRVIAVSDALYRAAEQRRVVDVEQFG
ncbi:MAG: Gfo/Idh/MocA family oxidoreductase [Actinomycetota bacterium]|nr:Gfo/Idh/MocA family oxidoreductase [Actinomycetota bacterium]